MEAKSHPHPQVSYLLALLCVIFTYCHITGFEDAEQQLLRCFKLLRFVLPRVFNNVQMVTTTGWAFAPYFLKAMAVQ